MSAQMLTDLIHAGPPGNPTVSPSGHFMAAPSGNPPVGKPGYVPIHPVTQGFIPEVRTGVVYHIRA